MSNVTLLERRWQLVPIAIWGAAMASVGVAVALAPPVAAPLLSSDGVLAPASKRILLVLQIVSVALAVLLAIAGRRLRRYTPSNAYLVYGVLFSLGAVVGAVLLCEASVRAASMVRPVRADRHFFFVHDPLLGWRHRPGAVVRFKDALVRINADGLREADVPRESSGGERRILVLGDSQVFGDGVTAEETFVHQLEADDTALQALNAGVIGYGTDQQLLYFEQSGARYGAQVTVVGLNAYDLRDNISSRVRSGYLKPQFSLVDGRLELTNVPISEGSVVDRAQRMLRTQSYLYTMIDQTFLRQPDAADGTGRRDPFAEVFPPDHQFDRALDVTDAILTRLASQVRLGGGRLVVAFLPYEMDFLGNRRYDASVDRLVDRLRSAATREGFLAFDLRPLLPSGRSHYLDTMHFNPEGHRLVAAVMKGLLRQHGVIPGSHVD